MYDLIKNLIDHTWQSGTTASGDQQYVYYITGALIIILTVVVIDMIFQIIRSFTRL